MSSVVITGSSKGVGFGLAKAFAAKGWDVVISGSSDVTTSAAVDRLVESKPQGRVIGQACQVTDPASMQALWDKASAEFGRVDIWVNNAGLAKTTQDFVDLPAEQIEQMVITNMVGTMNGVQVALKGMRDQGGGRIFNILGGGSDGSIREHMSVYSSTKFGLKYFTDSVVKETKGGPVLIGEVRPGILITEGWLREAKELPGGIPEKQKRALNALADRVDDVAPWLVDQMIGTSKHGAEIAWLTGPKIAGRFATSWRGRDVLSGFDV
jgi:NAD(P)-dependent dehydrogenase (short-subunit alcohol dehydrogenase family)